MCTNQNYILPDANHIIVIGDIHGDYELVLKILKFSKVIDDDLNWIGGDIIIVQLGDQIDSLRPSKKNNINLEANDIKILKFFNELNKKAEKSGGKVISLLGNHEIMNVLGDFRYVSKKDIDYFKNYKDLKTGKVFKNGIDGRKYAFSIGNEYANLLACTRYSAIIIGEFLFIHSAVLENFAKQFSIHKINTIVRKWLLNELKIQSEIADLNKIISNDSIFWNRVFGFLPPYLSIDNPDCEKYIKPILKIYNVNGIFIGHTPQNLVHNVGINSTCDDKLWRVDSGNSYAFNIIELAHKFKKFEVLEIINKKIKIKSF